MHCVSAWGNGAGRRRLKGQQRSSCVYDRRERLCDDTFVVHIEKAFADIDGAYPMINQQFVQHECMEYGYVNREDDAGSEGLRKASCLIVRHFGTERNCDEKRSVKR